MAAGLLVAATARAQLAVERITTGPTGFVQPLFGASAPGQPSTLYVVQKGGAIRSIDLTSPTATPQPFLTLDETNYPGASFDRQTGDFYVADVGQSAREEINVIPPTNVASRRA